MFKLKPTHYFLILIASLLLSIIYLNLFLNYNVNRLELTSQQTGAISAIPQTSLPPHYIVAITLALIVVGYLAWVWTKAEELRNKK